MEIGSFIELQLPCGMEYYSGDCYNGMDIVRLNSGRCAIYHACRILGCDTVWLPYYQCGTVRDFLNKKGVKIKYYHIDSLFEPTDIRQEKNECVVIVNYFGIMSASRMSRIASAYKNVIIDNSQAFFSSPIYGCVNVYSARKFAGVPDGAYVIGENASRFSDEYKKGYSSDTSLFLLSRTEYGCEGKTYALRTENENRIDREDICIMSDLTRKLLDATDYSVNISKRKENFATVHGALSAINKVDIEAFTDGNCVPMVYPLVVEDEKLLAFLLENKHFQGRWWRYVLSEVPEEHFEHYMSKYMVPVTIDQRYGKNELLPLCEMIKAFVLGNK